LKIMKDYQLRKRDFVYMLSIFVLILIFVIGNYYWRTESAGTTLNNVATGVSSVLAVVAILITLWDVAGQRNSIADIRETAEKLEKTQKSSHNLFEEMSSQIQSINNFKETIQESVDTNKAISTDVSEAIEQLKDNGQKDENEDLLNKLEDIQNKVSKYDKKVNLAELAGTLTIPSKHNENEVEYKIRNYLEDYFPQEYKASYKTIVGQIKSELGYSASVVQNTLRKIEKESKLEIDRYNDTIIINKFSS